MKTLTTVLVSLGLSHGIAQAQAPVGGTPVGPSAELQPPPPPAAPQAPSNQAAPAANTNSQPMVVNYSNQNDSNKKDEKTPASVEAKEEAVYDGLYRVNTKSFEYQKDNSANVVVDENDPLIKQVMERAAKNKK